MFPMIHPHAISRPSFLLLELNNMQHHYARSRSHTLNEPELWHNIDLWKNSGKVGVRTIPRWFFDVLNEAITFVQYKFQHLMNSEVSTESMNSSHRCQNLTSHNHMHGRDVFSLVNYRRSFFLSEENHLSVISSDCEFDVKKMVADAIIETELTDWRTYSTTSQSEEIEIACHAINQTRPDLFFRYVSWPIGDTAITR